MAPFFLRNDSFEYVLYSFIRCLFNIRSERYYEVNSIKKIVHFNKHARNRVDFNEMGFLFNIHMK